jgi:hypothetical protein
MKKKDDDKVTPCDITSVLSQQVYDLFCVQKHDLKGHRGGLSEGGEQRHLDTADNDMGPQQIKVNRQPNMKVLVMGAFGRFSN